MTDQSPNRSTLQAILDQRVTEKRTVGAVLALLDPTGPTQLLTAGTSGKPDLALTDRTVFEIGSVTKTFTCALLAQMAATGELTLDDPVQSLLPAHVRMPTRHGRQITLVDLATHTSGLPRLPTNFRPASMTNPYADFSVDDLYGFLSGHTLERDIGAQYEYSNVGGGLLGHVLALRGGTTFEALLTDRILTPLEMTETRITLTPDLRARLAIGHDQEGRQVGIWDFPALAGTGALRSTVHDMTKYLAANLSPARTPLGAILARTHRTLRPAIAGQMSVGLGWHIQHAPGGDLVWHNGGTGGYRTFVGFHPVRHVGVVLLTNSAIDPDDIAFHALDPALPLVQPPAAHHEVSVDPQVLARYIGVYQLMPGVTLTVTLEDGYLMAQPTGQGKLRLYPESETTFFIREADHQGRFVIDDAEAVVALVMVRSGQEMTLPKIG